MTQQPMGPADEDATLLQASIPFWETDDDLDLLLRGVVDDTAFATHVVARCMGLLGITTREELAERQAEVEAAFAFYTEAFLTGQRFTIAKQNRERAQREEDTSVD